MAIFKNDPFPGVNYGEFQSWAPIQLPTGEILYEVPGHSGYVFDPVASNATGRKVFRPNPKLKIKEAERLEKQQKQEEFNRSPVGQILPVAASVGGMYAANQLMTPTNALAQIGQGGTTAGVLTPAQAAAQGATGVTASMPAQAGVQSLANGGATAGVGPVADGSAYASNFATPASNPMFGAGGSVYNTNGMLGAEGSFAPLNVAGAAAGMYGMYKASQMSNKRQGALSGGLSGAAAGTAIMPGIGTAIGAGLGVLSGLAAHESTKDRSTRRYGELSSLGGGADFQNMANQGLQEDLAGSDTWDIGDDKSAAPIDLMTRSFGVLKTFGPNWAKVPADKRKEIVKRMVDRDLINSKQGSYLVDDTAAAQQIFDEVTKGGSSPARAAAQGATQGRPRSAVTQNLGLR